MVLPKTEFESMVAGAVRGGGRGLKNRKTHNLHVFTVDIALHGGGSDSNWKEAGKGSEFGMTKSRTGQLV